MKTFKKGIEMNPILIKILQKLFTLVTPFITSLIQSKVVPKIKRKMYEKVNNRIDTLITDLAQNASKAIETDNKIKKATYIEGTKLGVDTIRIIAEKLNKAAIEIENILIETGNIKDEQS